MMLLSCCIAVSSYASSPVIIFDRIEQTPVEGATVISDRGMILGITAQDGSIPVEPEKDYPLTIRCVGFKPLTISHPSDTIQLEAAVYELSEVAVCADERPIMKALYYVREYCSGATQTDTMQLYADYMMENYYPVERKKVKGYKSSDAYFNPVATRRAARFANSSGKDSIAVPDKFDNVSNLSFYHILLDFPCYSAIETEKIQKGATSDSIMGKYSLFCLYRKWDDKYSEFIDILGDHDGHKYSPNLFKLLGLTMDFDKLQTTYLYNSASDTIHSVHDFIYCSGAMHGIAKGKMYKFLLGSRNVDIDCWAELYPVDIQYLTVEEYTEERKERKKREKIPFREPKNLQPLPPAVQRIIDRVKKDND